jgi:hypothetical protein
MDTETKAKEMGWAPLDQWRGDPDKWVSAETFVDRGETVMPILRKNNERLLGQIEALKGEVTQITGSLKEAQESMAEFRKYHDEVSQRAYEKAVKDLKDQRREALKEGDGERVVVLEDALETLAADAPTGLGKQPTTPAPSPSPAPAGAPADPVLRSWLDDNATWLKDPEKQAYATGISQYLRATTKVVGREFLDLVTKEVEKKFSGPTRGVEGGTRQTSRSGGKSYADLPADAKAACDRFASKLAGTGKPFKTVAEYRSDYVSKYDWT